MIFSRLDFILLQIVLQKTEIMNQGKTVFAQIMSLIPRYEFDKCLKRNNGNRHAIEFKCRDQFMVMSFAQFTDQDSLRSIDATLVALSSKLFERNKGSIPTFIYLTEAAVHDSKTMSLIPVEPGNGMFLQMNQTTTAYQVVLRNEPECCILADLDCHIQLSAACHC